MNKLQAVCGSIENDLKENVKPPVNSHSEQQHSVKHMMSEFKSLNFMKVFFQKLLPVFM